MAPPTLTARTQPTGYQLPDGYDTTIALSVNPSIQFWEMSLKPGGISAGGKINNTTMFNKRVRTGRAPKLREWKPITGKAAYDPDLITSLMGIIGVEGSVTIHYSSGDTRTFYGYLDDVEFDELREKELPTLAYTIVETDWDPVNNVEVDAVYVSAPGT